MNLRDSFKQLKNLSDSFNAIVELCAPLEKLETVAQIEGEIKKLVAERDAVEASVASAKQELAQADALVASAKTAAKDLADRLYAKASEEARPKIDALEKSIEDAKATLASIVESCRISSAAVVAAKSEHAEVEAKIASAKAEVAKLLGL